MPLQNVFSEVFSELKDKKTKRQSSILSLFSLFLRSDIGSIIPIIPTHLWCSARFSSRPPLVHPLHYSTQFLIKASSVNHHLYADDTQLFLSFSPNNFSESIEWSSSTCSQANFLLDDLKSRLPQPFKHWIYTHRLSGTTKENPRPIISLNLDSTSTDTFTPTSPVRKLGVICDQNLSFSDHITHLSHSCFMHISELRRIRHMLDLKTATTIATSIVHDKLDYCNSLFLNTDITQINRLRAVQNALAPCYLSAALSLQTQNTTLQQILPDLSPYIPPFQRLRFYGRCRNLEFTITIEYNYSFIHSFITEIYIALLQGYYSEALPTLARLKRRGPNYISVMSSKLLYYIKQWQNDAQ